MPARLRPRVRLPRRVPRAHGPGTGSADQDRRQQGSLEDTARIPNERIAEKRTNPLRTVPQPRSFDPDIRGVDQLTRADVVDSDPKTSMVDPPRPRRHALLPAEDVELPDSRGQLGAFGNLPEAVVGLGLN